MIAALPEYDNADSPLNAMDGQLSLVADKLNWRGLQMNNVQLDAASEGGY